MVIRDPKQGVEYDPMATQQGRVRVSSIGSDGRGGAGPVEAREVGQVGDYLR